MFKRSRFLLSVLVCLIVANPSSFAANSCRILFQQEFSGYFDYDTENTIRFISTDKNLPGLKNKEIAVIEYDYYEQLETLYINWIKVNSNVRGTGLSNTIIADLLEHFPKTKKISAYLTDRNFEVYNENLAAKKNITEALMSTPFYQAFAKLGFTEIIENQAYDGKVIVVLKRKP